MTDRFVCSDASVARDEGVVATASQVRAWLLPVWEHLLTQPRSPRMVVVSFVRMNCMGWSPWNSANHDADTAGQPCSEAHPGWVHTMWSSWSHTSDMASRSRCSKAA